MTQISRHHGLRVDLIYYQRLRATGQLNGRSRIMSALGADISSCFVFRSNRFCSASDSAYSYTFLCSVVCLSACRLSVTFVSPA